MEDRSLISAVARVGVTGLLLAALLVPHVRDRDSFPLSTHPMYATARDRAETLVSVVGLTDAGDVVRLSLSIAADTDDPLVAEAAIESAIRRGDEAETCREIAGRLRELPGVGDVVEIAIVTERVDLVDFVDSATVQSRTAHATCAVGR